MAEHEDPTKNPHFYTWTWDVWISGGNWRAEYGWEKPAPNPRRLVRNVQPLFTHHSTRPSSVEGGEGLDPPGCEGCNCAACELRRKHEATPGVKGLGDAQD